MLNVHFNFLLAFSLLLWWKTCQEKKKNQQPAQSKLFSTQYQLLKNITLLTASLVATLYWLLLKWELYHLWDAWCSKLTSVICPEWGDGESPRWRTSRRTAQVPLLVDVGIPSISAPPTDWSPNENPVPTDFPMKNLCQRSKMLCWVFKSWWSHLNPVTRNSTHSTSGRTVFLCFPTSMAIYTNRNTRGHKVGQRSPHILKLGLSPATVHSMPPFQVCNCPQSPFSTFSCTSLPLESFLPSRPPWNTPFLCEMDNVSNTAKGFMFCFWFYMTDNFAVCIFVQYSEYSVVEGSICRTQQGQQEPLRQPQLFTLQKDYACPCVV